MKKLSRFLVFGMVAILFLSSILMVSASSIERRNFDFSKKYTLYEHNSAQRCTYDVGWLFGDVWGKTAVSVSNDSRGYSSCTLTGLNGVTGSAYTGDSVGISGGGWVETGKATVKGQNYAKRANHYSRRFWPESPTEYFVTNYYST